MDRLSSICAGLGSLEEDDNGKRIGYAKGQYCSGTRFFFPFFLQLNKKFMLLIQMILIPLCLKYIGR